VIGLLALFLALIWMLRDEKDKTRPLLVFALVLNLCYGYLLSVVMGKEDSLLPWKYDLFLLHLDASLGVSAAAIALPLQGLWRIPLNVIYQLMVPMMICWYFVTRNRNRSRSLVLAYVSELVMGPLLYVILPACGPAYAFGSIWLTPPLATAHPIRFSGMPNAFPSLHLGTALVLVLYAEGKLRRGISLMFFVGTALATISTGEHYLIDLVAGLAFGCFAANIGYSRFRSALAYLGIAITWPLAIRFEFPFLLAHPGKVRSCAALTAALAILAVFREWRVHSQLRLSAQVAYDAEPQTSKSRMQPGEALAD
jgi:PAP2 superfamily